MITTMARVTDDPERVAAMQWPQEAIEKWLLDRGRLLRITLPPEPVEARDEFKCGCKIVWRVHLTKFREYGDLKPRCTFARTWWTSISS